MPGFVSNFDFKIQICASSSKMIVRIKLLAGLGRSANKKISQIHIALPHSRAYKHSKKIHSRQFFFDQNS